MEEKKSPRKPRTNTEINGKKYYRITKTIGHKVVNGKKVPVRKSFYGTSKTDAENRYKEWCESKVSESVDPTRIVGDLAVEFNEWFKSRKEFAPSTIDLYIGAYKAHFDDLRLFYKQIGQLTHEDIDDAYELINCSEDALSTLHKWMKHFIKYCGKKHYCDDFSEKITVPAKEKVQHSEEIIIWEKDELKLIHEKMSGHRYYPCILLGLYAGLRIGEVLGLKWEDIRNDAIHVNRQLQKGIIKEPKYNSKRIVPLHPRIKEALEDYPNKSGYIFLTSTGNLIEYHNFRNSLNRAYEKYGIPQKKFHAYRATFCTNLCEAGVPIEKASKLCGHKNIYTTIKHYALVKDTDLEDCISMLK